MNTFRKESQEWVIGLVRINQRPFDDFPIKAIFTCDLASAQQPVAVKIYFDHFNLFRSLVLERPLRPFVSFFAPSVQHPQLSLQSGPTYSFSSPTINNCFDINVSLKNNYCHPLSLIIPFTRSKRSVGPIFIVHGASGLHRHIPNLPYIHTLHCTGSV